MQLSPLTGKEASMTGASQGIGAGVAQGLGAAVVVHDSSSKAGADRVAAGGERSRGADAPCRGYFLYTQEFLSKRASR
jgi:NAD(P)-dependent dehydrogenase (short-subunit alcohol dehydrogenase family)